MSTKSSGSVDVTLAAGHEDLLPEEVLPNVDHALSPNCGRGRWELSVACVPQMPNATSVSFPCLNHAETVFHSELVEPGHDRPHKLQRRATWVAVSLETKGDSPEA